MDAIWSTINLAIDYISPNLYIYGCGIKSMRGAWISDNHIDMKSSLEVLLLLTMMPRTQEIWENLKLVGLWLYIIFQI